MPLRCDTRNKGEGPMNNAMFESIALEPEQKELLAKLVEAARNVPSDRRQKFLCAPSHTGASVNHVGLDGGTMPVYPGDLETLADEGLIRLSHTTTDSYIFDVTPRGFNYYVWLKQRVGESIQRVEAEVKHYLDASQFRRKYPAAYEKWCGAESKLWASDSEEQLTQIGHLCREAMQEFATALVDSHRPKEVDADKTRSKNRVRAVLELQSSQRGTRVKAFLDALNNYWEAVSDLAQRQEHDSLKEGWPLVWEDGRRMVFQLALVMFEIDRAVSRTR